MFRQDWTKDEDDYSAWWLIWWCGGGLQKDEATVADGGDDCRSEKGLRRYLTDVDGNERRLGYVGRRGWMRMGDCRSTVAAPKRRWILNGASKFRTLPEARDRS
ncbi:hypothetical protein PIB30_103690 [Stylosanthes scabra]|uniref:Uncharacterized protein n=1 Tax=Stylosanthes scabra TaxID=79078 RepID=A0ABU6QZ92_9FABA|nr:hypothetical protein [Stylosanthes scabra]